MWPAFSNTIDTAHMNVCWLILQDINMETDYIREFNFLRGIQVSICIILVAG